MEFFQLFLFLCASYVHGIRHCESDWLQMFSSCYVIRANKMSYADALTICSVNDGRLPNIHDNKLLSYVIENAYNTTFWSAQDSNANGTCSFNKGTTTSNSCTDKKSLICEDKTNVALILHCESSAVSLFSDWCFYLGNKTDRNQGAKFCSNINGTLATLSDRLLVLHARALAISKNLTMWVGNSDQEAKQCMKIGPEGEFHSSTTGCDDIAFPLCEKPTKDTILRSQQNDRYSTTPEVPLKCHFGFDISDGRAYCYYESSYIADRMTWIEARKFCMSYGGNLASYSDITEENSALGSRRGTGEFWFGLFRNPFGDPNELLWSDGRPMTYKYMRWDKGVLDLNAIELTDSCGYHSGLESAWKLGNCNAKRWFVCKVPKNFVSLTTTLKPILDDDSEEKQASGNSTLTVVGIVVLAIICVICRYVIIYGVRYLCGWYIPCRFSKQEDEHTLT